jgi:hypothetical protein
MGWGCAAAAQALGDLIGDDQFDLGFGEKLAHDGVGGGAQGLAMDGVVQQGGDVAAERVGGLDPVSFWRSGSWFVLRGEPRASAAGGHAGGGCGVQQGGDGFGAAHPTAPDEFCKEGARQMRWDRDLGRAHQSRSRMKM